MDRAPPGGVDGRLCLHILDQAREAVVVQNLDGRVEWINPAAERMFGWTLTEVHGKAGAELVLPEEMRQGARLAYDPGTSLFGGYHVTEHRRRDGTRFWNQQSFTLVGAGRDRRVVITCRDVTEQVDTERALRAAQVDLQHAAFHDDLTGLANRKRLKAYLTSDIVARHITRQEIGILQVDVDKFKEINDTLGHAAGDATLCHVADALRSAAAPHDLVCRTGGDEFLLVCLRIASEEALLSRAELVLKQIARPLPWKDQTIRIGTSIGASLSRGGASEGEALIQQADQALYAAKNQGRGRVVVYSDALGREQTEQNRLARDIRTAIAEDQFEIYLQPQLDLRQNRIIGCEALLGWNHPDKGLLLPGAFLDTARRTGLLAELDYRSMNLALDALCTLRNSGFPEMRLAINVSSEILADANYPGLLDWALQSRGVPADSICVEILETTILHGPGYDMIGAVDRLKRLGVQIALDDFGTGYAGLAHMTAFHIDAIKLDRSMIARLESDPRNRVIVRSIIRLCGLLQIQVVAEGVETAIQLDILRRAHCPMIQGFGLARPMPVGDMVGWLTRHTPLPGSFAFGTGAQAGGGAVDLSLYRGA